jgi:23S rRNA (uracil1939-C5)-methyltransferase
MARRKVIIENVEIIDIADKGQAIGRTPTGEIVAVQKDCVPGDVIDLLVLRKKKGLKQGVVKQFKKKSSDRVEPFCEHFGTCGGCKWQNLDYSKQLSLKENSVRQAIKRIAKDDEAKVKKIKGATLIREYRNKLEYTFSSKRWLSDEEINSSESFDNRKGVGFHISGTFDKVLHLDKCHLQSDLSNEIRREIDRIAEEKNYSYYDIRNNHGFLRNVVVRNSELGEWMVNIVFGENDTDAIDELFNILVTTFPQIDSWCYMINSKMNSSTFDIEAINVSGKDHIMEQLGDIKYRISPKSFFQTNSHQASILYDQAKEFAQLSPLEIVYDLYTGTGSIALYLANQCKKVIGIEEVSEAIDDARLNALDNNITNAEFLVGDVRTILLPEFATQYGSPDVVITDPPRAGMHTDVIDTLLQLAAPKIVYISCNPSTQARDILLLKEKYDLIEVVPVDMFPHTSHIESVALLNLKGE